MPLKQLTLFSFLSCSILVLLSACNAKPNNEELKKHLPHDQRIAYQVLEGAFDDFLAVNFPEGNYHSQLIQFHQDFFTWSTNRHHHSVLYNMDMIHCDSIQLKLETSGLRKSMLLYGYETSWANIRDEASPSGLNLMPVPFNSTFFSIDSLSKRSQLYFDPTGDFWTTVGELYGKNDALHDKFVEENRFKNSRIWTPSLRLIETLKNPSEKELKWAKAISVGYIFPLLLAQHCEWITFNPNRPYESNPLPLQS